MATSHTQVYNVVYFIGLVLWEAGGLWQEQSNAGRSQRTSGRVGHKFVLCQTPGALSAAPTFG